MPRRVLFLLVILAGCGLPGLAQESSSQPPKPEPLPIFAVKDPQHPERQERDYLGRSIKRHFNNIVGRPCIEYMDGSQMCLGGEAVIEKESAATPWRDLRTGDSKSRRFLNLVGRTAEAMIMPWKDWQFSAAAWSMFATAYTNSKTTADVMKRCPNCFEGNPLARPFVGRRPTLRRALALELPATFGLAVAVKWFKEGEEGKSWLIAPVVLDTAHSIAAWHNSRIGYTKIPGTQVCPGTGAGCR